jgi:hypothetical protein
MNDDFEDSPARMHLIDQGYVRQGRLIGALVFLLSVAFVAWMLFGIRL